jgi:hypothetical protein
MTKDLTLPVGEFGQQRLERFARGRSRSPDTAVRTAVLYYLADRDSARPSWVVPELGAQPESPRPTLKVRLDDATWAALVEEAKLQAVTPEALAVHAVLYFVADLDSGRIADRLAEALEDFE